MVVTPEYPLMFAVAGGTLVAFALVFMRLASRDDGWTLLSSMEAVLTGSKEREESPEDL